MDTVQAVGTNLSSLKTRINMQWSPRVLITILILLLCHLMACNNNNKDVTLGQVKTSSSRTKGKKQEILVVADNTKSTYENIKGNIPRLKAMLSGRFTVYNTESDSAGKNYKPWLVNENTDSILVYTVPVGEASKNGHWLYIYQYMTSLPDDPIYEVFVKLEEINRDSIIATYYEAPDDFEYSIDDILTNPIKLFKEFNFEKLPLSETGETVWYERQSLLRYNGMSNWIPIEKTPRADLENGFKRDYYTITPEVYHFGKEYYNKDKELVVRTKGARLVKQQMLSKDYHGK